MNEPVWRHARRSEASAALAPADEAEAQRAAKFRDRAHAQDFLHARNLMRALIAEVAGCAPGKVQLTAFDDAQPVTQGLETAGISWSRSGCDGLAALMEAGQVGADIERVRPIETGPLLDMIAGPEEQALVRGLGEGEAGLRGFYRLWCAKEAVLKWRGTGLRGGAKSVTIPPEIVTGKAVEAVMQDSARPVRLKMLPLGRDCVACLAFSG